MAVNDGSANAPAGSPQLPNLLDAYGANRPAWNVAGVDYYVGVPQGLSLKNPATISMAGVSVDTTNHMIYVTGNNVTLDGYDFSVNGGWGVVVQGSNTKILDSSFVVGANSIKPILAAVSSSNLTVAYCTIDGHNDGNISGLIEDRGSGTLTVQYSWLKNAGGDMIQMHNGGQAANLVVEYNVIQNAGMAPGAHGDYTEFMDGPFTATIKYNTTTQNGGASQGFMVEPDIGSSAGTIISGEIGNNTFTGSVNAFTGVTVADIVNTFTVHDNYFDPSKSSSGLSFGGPYRGGPDDNNAKSIYVHNVDMTNGSLEQDSNAPSTPSSPTPPSAPTIASFSNDSGVVGDHITNDTTLALSGTATAGDALQIFDGSKLLGTVTANSSGAWNYTTAALANGSHSFTVTDTVKSVTSPVLNVTVDSVAPANPVISSNSVSSSNVTLTGTAEANSTVTVFDGTTQLGTASANASGAWTYKTAALPNGNHNFTATDTDAAGNTSGASAAVNATVNAPPNLVTNGSFETGTFSGWTLGGNFGVVAAGPQTSVDSNAESGLFAANIGAIGSDATLSQAIQTTAGQHYTLTFWLANGSSGPNDFTVKWNGATVLSLVNAPTQGYTQYTYDVVGTAGTSQLLISGRQDPSHWSLDAISVVPVGSQAPAAPSIASFSTDSGIVGDHITSDTSLTLSGTAVANSTVKVFDGSVQVGTTTAHSDGSWDYIDLVLTDAVHLLTATATSAGQTSALSAALSVTIDTKAPNAPLETGESIVNGDQVTVHGTAEANSVIKIYDGNNVVGNGTTGADGSWTVTTSALPVGSHDLQATSTDAAGNTSALSLPLDPVIGGKGPVDIDFTDLSQSSLGVTNIKGTADPSSVIKLYDGTTALGSTTSGTDGSWNFTSQWGLSNKVHTITAQEVNSSGQVVATSSGEAILGSTRNDTLTGTTANDLFVGKGGQDTFAFAANFGNDVITDFAASGRSHDVIQFSKTVFDSFASVLAHASQVGQDVVISGSDTLTLKNTKLSSLDSHDFHFT